MVSSDKTTLVTDEQESGGGSSDTAPRATRLTMECARVPYVEYMYLHPLQHADTQWELGSPMMAS